MLLPSDGLLLLGLVNEGAAPHGMAPPTDWGGGAACAGGAALWFCQDSCQLTFWPLLELKTLSRSARAAYLSEGVVEVVEPGVVAVNAVKPPLLVGVALDKPGFIGVRSAANQCQISTD